MFHSSMSILYSLTPPCQPCCLLSPSEVTLALLDSANDKDPVVREQVRKSILTLGKQQPNKVLSMCQDYLVKHPKVRHHHYYCHLLLISYCVEQRLEHYNRKSPVSLAIHAELDVGQCMWSMFVVYLCLYLC